LSRVKKVAGFRWLERLGGEVGQALMPVLGPVPGDGLVWPDLVVLDAVFLGVFGEHDGVVDLVDVEPFVLQVAVGQVGRWSTCVTPCFAVDNIG
jgi:hypothetical protein